MKTKEELNALKEEVEALNNKLCELTTEELEQVSGGGNSYFTYMRCSVCGFGDIWAGRFEDLTCECPHCKRKDNFHSTGVTTDYPGLSEHDMPLYH